MEKYNFGIYPVCVLTNYDKQCLERRKTAEDKEKTYLHSIEDIERRVSEIKPKPVTGLAIVTGEPSGVMVIDLDMPYEGKEDKYNGVETWKKLINGEEVTRTIKDTSTGEVINVETYKLNLDELNEEELKILKKCPVMCSSAHNGFHLYFKYRPGLTSISNVLDGIDIRTDGGVIVAPGTVIYDKVKTVDDKTGKTYYKNTGEAKKYKQLRGNKEDIPEICDPLFRLLESICQSPRKASKKVKEGKALTSDTSNNKKDGFYTNIKEGQGAGRDKTLFDFCIKMKKTISDKEFLLEVARAYNNKYFTPPLDDYIVEQKVTSALSYGNNEPYIDGKGKIDVGAYVSHIIDTCHIYRTGNTIRIYNDDDKYYKPYTSEDIKRQFYYKKAEEYKEQCSANIDHTKAQKFTETLFDILPNRSDNKDRTRFICMKDYILDLKNNSLCPHTPSVLSEFKINANFINNNEEYQRRFNESRFKKYLEMTIIDKDTIELLQELFGNTFAPNQEAIEGAVFLNGHGSNGKSVLFRILESFFPSELTASLAISTFKDGNKYDLSMCEGKVVNLVRDDPFNGDFSNLFKSFVSGEPITIERKYKDKTRITVNMASWYGVNFMGNTSDKSHGLFRRLIIIPFPKTFGTEEQVKNGEADYIKDVNISKDIIENELDIVLTWAILGLIRLKKNNYKLTQSKAVIESQKEYKEDNNTAYAFLKHRTRKAPGHRVRTADLYKIYQEYCEDEYAQKPLQRAKFFAEVKAFGFKKVKSSGYEYIIDIGLLDNMEEVDSTGNPFI